MSTLVAIVGSATPPGRLRRAVAEALARAADAGAGVELIDLGERTIAAADGRPPAELEDDTAEAVEAISGAEAVLLATPVYRGSPAGVLKNLLDHVPVEALERKPVAIVAMGASQHHYLGAERHLRDILSFFGADLLPVAGYLTSGDFEAGEPSAAAAAELDALVAELRDRTARPAYVDPSRLRPLAARRPPR
ncbi:MAG TPA: NADPH-dependent FMN reductase [Solirubrobacterales bacterium]|nr:NADPH-dependent FMN reductase [Solirubrobacterales bacterium]